jgi:hypothetical protein
MGSFRTFPEYYPPSCFLVSVGVYYKAENIQIEQGLLSHETSMATTLYPIPSSEKTLAAKYLIDHIPDETLSEIANLIRENGKDWGVDHHHGFGTGIRNLLREGGFEWGSYRNG